MIAHEDMYIGLPITEGNATKSTGWGGEDSLFGLGIPITEGNATKSTGWGEGSPHRLFGGLGKFPEGTVMKNAWSALVDEERNLFGLGDDAAPCTCDTIKNAIILLLGGLVAWKGVPMNLGRPAEYAMRGLSGIFAAYGAYGLYKSYQAKSAAPAPAPTPAPGTHGLYGCPACSAP